MNVDEFRADLEAELKNEFFNSGQSSAAAFAEKITDMMRNAEYLNGDYQESFFMGKHKRNNFRVDGWLRDDADNSIVIFIVHLSEENMTASLAEKNFKMLEVFVEAVLTSKLDIEESTSTDELAESLINAVDEKIKFILFTNA